MLKAHPILAATLLSFLTLQAGPPVWAAEPPAWKKPAPTDAADLLAIQHKLQQSLPAVMKATVAVLVGGGAGSGVIVSPDGLVLTAAHVVQSPGRDVRLILSDGRMVRGKSLGTAPVADAGMIQILAKGPFPTAPMGDLAQVHAGDWCFAVGHPEGPDMKRGAVVRLGRVISATNLLVWSDCKLLGGDSGGPLLDMDGRVIGIHSWISVPTEANFHVPIAAFKLHWDELAAGKAISEPELNPSVMLGVVTKDDPKGPRIGRVLPDTAAQKAGLKPGDVITALDGHPIGNSAVLRQLVTAKKPDESVKLTVERGGKSIELEAKLTAPPPLRGPDGKPRHRHPLPPGMPSPI